MNFLKNDVVDGLVSMIPDLIFNAIFTMFVAVFILVIMRNYGVSLSTNGIILLGAAIFIIIQVYNNVQIIFNILKDKLYAKKYRDRKYSEAIKTIEKHGFDVAMVRTYLPKDVKKEELRDCVNAIITLNKDNMKFILIDKNGKHYGETYFVGEKGKTQIQAKQLTITSE